MEKVPLTRGERLRKAVEYVRFHAPDPVSIGVVLGSGLGAFGTRLEALKMVPYGAIPGMPPCGVAGHGGNLCLGKVAGVGVACLQGRVHLYEGHPAESVTFGVSLLAQLGCKIVLLTNAAGGINPAFSPGNLMLLCDHLNLTGHNPLTGENDDTLGPRFPDMTVAYDPEVRRLAKEAACACGIYLYEGVYAALTGPSLETPAEVRMLRTLGADAVGMSTVPEVLAMRHRGVRVGAISCIANSAAGLSVNPIRHEDVIKTAASVQESFTKLLTTWITNIARELL